MLSRQSQQAWLLQVLLQGWPAKQQMSELKLRFQRHLSLTKTWLDACRRQMTETLDVHRQVQAELGIQGDSDDAELQLLAGQACLPAPGEILPAPK